jgi:hypothetical protein
MTQAGSFWLLIFAGNLPVRRFAMPKIRIKRRCGEGISISGPATIHVSRRVMLTIRAPRDARVARLTRQGGPAPAMEKDRSTDGADGYG